MPPAAFEKLLSIEDISAFRDFISDEKNKDLILRVPITAIFKGSKTFGPDQSIIGDINDEKNQIEINLNDTRMGIGIQSHLLTGCEENICPYWVDVIWQDMDGKHSTPDEDSKYQVMALLFVDNTVDLDRSFVYVEK